MKKTKTALAKAVERNSRDQEPVQHVKHKMTKYADAEHPQL
eukprot:CAMPEP_0114265940 /NCGR_PEP_ID=MMETSP0058-20121206/24277_1 /TAXON_ID=36894 /ORGANISM="Pyramimonas parkeae, CCMP726" /LENGTH=40 /DNA_ID= /DNA_START= /DNA_END= /DNA_ORIENTATION=